MSKSKRAISLSIEKLAEMTNLVIDEEEKKELASPLKKTIAIFSVLQQKVKELENLPPTFHVGQNKNVIRPDQKKPSLPRRKILTHGSYFLTKRRNHE